MTHQRQPFMSKLCGQTCVAIIADCPLEDAIYSCGRRGRTTEQRLRRGLKERRFLLHDFVRVGIDSRTTDPLDGQPGTKLARVRRVATRGYHWVVIDGGLVYDPLFEQPMRCEEFRRRLRTKNQRITSFASVTKMPPEFVAGVW